MRSILFKGASCLILMLFASLITKAQLVGGGTYPVNGTSNAPTSFATINELFTYLNTNGTSGSGNITIEIESGYTGESGTIAALNAYPGMSSTRPILLRPASGVSKTISTAPGANAAVIRFNGTQYFTIDGSNSGSGSRDLTVTTSSNTNTVRLIDMAPTSTSSCTNITLKNLNLIGNSSTTAVNTYAAIYLGSGTASPGVALRGGNDNLLMENNFIGAVRNGIFLRGTNDSTTMDNNTVVRNNIIGGEIAPGGSVATNYMGGANTCAGIYFNSQNNALIENNIVRNSMPGFYYFRGIFLEALAAAGAANRNVTITRNRVYSLVYTGSGGYGMHGIRVQTNNRINNAINITNNFVYDIGSDGDNTANSFEYGIYGISISSNAGSANTLQGVNIYHNTVHLYNNGYRLFGTAWTNQVAACIATQTNVAGGVKVVNNILQNTYEGVVGNTTGPRTLGFFAQNATLNPFTVANNGRSNYNNIYVNGPNAGTYIASVTGTNITTFAGWQAQNVDSNSTNLKLGFTPNSNLYIAHKGINDKGTNVGVTVDIDGKPRSSTTPDIGASEFGIYYNLTVDKVKISSGCNLSTLTPAIVIKNVSDTTLVSGTVLPVYYVFDNGSLVSENFTLPKNIALGDTINFTFSSTINLSNYATYSFETGVKLPSDSIKSNDSVIISLTNYDCISSTPYMEDFENSDGGFTTGGGNASLWQWGTPRKTVITGAASGSKCWITDTTADYPNYADASLVSPIFDFTTACEPKMRFKIAVEVENNYDAVILETTTDNINWSKHTAMTPGYNNTSGNGPVAPPKWSYTDGIWRTIDVDLSAYANAPLFRFRLKFGSDISNVGDGVGFDSLLLSFYPDISNVNLFASNSNDTVYIKEQLAFSSSVSTTEGVFHEWYVNDTLLSSDSVFEYATENGGSFTLKYKYGNCKESDSIERTLVVVQPIGGPIIDFYASRNEALTEEVLTLYSKVSNGGFNYKWIITPDSGYDYVIESNIQSFDYEPGSDSTSRNPKLQFYIGNVYDICLIAENVNGIDTVCKSDYINVRNNYVICSNPTSVFPTGVVFDNGGRDRGYTNNQNCNIVITPPCADSIYLDLKKLNTELNADFVRIFDGPLNGKKLWDSASFPQGLSGTLAGKATSYVAFSGMVTIQFVTSGAITDEGFEIEYHSVDVLTPPVASFTADTAICPGNSVNIVNTTDQNGSTLFYWDVENDGIYEGFGESFNYVYDFPGTYELKLLAENCLGADSMIKTIVVSNPSAAPTPGFYAHDLTPSVGDQVNLFDTTGGCVDSRTWVIVPNKFTFVSGNASSKNPVIVFTDSGCFTVKLFVTNAAGTDSVVNNCYIQVRKTCVPVSFNVTSDIGINRLQFNTIDNSSSSGTSAYTNYYNTISTTVTHGAVYTLTATRNTSYNNANFKTWIDYNRDGDFADAGEEVIVIGASMDKVYSGTIKIDRNAPVGFTRMRVGMVFGNDDNDPCNIADIAEYEDYKLIIREDDEAPEITLLGADTIYLEAGRPYIEPNATAFDAIDGDLTPFISIGGLIDTTQPNTYYLDYNVSDTAGNAAPTKTRVVIVTPDTTDPVMMLRGNAIDTIALLDSYTDSGATAWDILNGDLTPIIQINRNLDSSVLGTYTITYSVTDLAGNTASIERKIVVVDRIIPVITLIGDDTLYHQVNTPYFDPGSMVTDNYDTGLVATVTGIVATSTPGIYTLYFDATDRSGNVAVTVIRTIIIIDSIRPTITLIGPDPYIMDVFTSYYEFGALVDDDFDDSLDLIIESTVDTAVLGSYTVTYKVVDDFGNPADSVVRTVIVIDRVAPVITVHDPIFITRTEPKPSLRDSIIVTDNYYQESQLTVYVTENINTSLPGYYTVEYVAVDPSNNTSAVAKGLVVVVAGAGVTDLDKELAVNIYPNPSRDGHFNLGFFFDQPEEITVGVFNHLGQQLSEKQYLVSRENITLDLANLPAGTYYLNIGSDVASVNRKIVIVK